MSHKLQLHLLLDHISANITANAAIGLRSLASHVCSQSVPLCSRTQGTAVRNQHLLGVIIRVNMSENRMFHSSFQMCYRAVMFCIS